MRTVFIVLSMIFANFSYAGQWSDWFTIDALSVSDATNMHFRVDGMPAQSSCTHGPTWAYVNEIDSGAKGKISTLLAAYTSGKNVTLFVEPTDIYENGTKYCHIIELKVN